MENTFYLTRVVLNKLTFPLFIQQSGIIENEPAEGFVFGPLENEICTHRFKTASSAKHQ